jgi:hypothetical protein
MRIARPRRARTSTLAVLCVATLLAIPKAGSAQAPPSLRFGPPVLVSPGPAWTWEPILLIDRFSNVFISARKTLEQLLLAPDPRSPTLTRSMSWLWISSDGGRTFDNMHGYPLDLENHAWGYESDIALDDAGHLYQVDQTYVDQTIARWTVTGRGNYRFDSFRPFIPTAQPVDDRPWLAAHGNGTVLYIAQAGAAYLNPFGRRGGEAYGPGRYSAYRSTDGGKRFDLFGRSLNESGGCRPAADHRPGSKLLYVVCTNDGGAQGVFEMPHGEGTLWAYVSRDNGATYTRYEVGHYNADAETYDWPLVTVAPNGDVWALHVDAGKVKRSGNSFEILTNRLNLYRSRDRGRTWSRQDITPVKGRYRWGGLTVSANGRLALAIHHRPDKSSPWRVYAASFRPGAIPALVSVDHAHPVYDASNPEPPSEMIGIAFAPDGSLNVAWTRMETLGPIQTPRVYFARSLSR